MSDTKWLSQVKRGLLELAILNIVSNDRVYGYQVVKRLTTVPGLVITAGTIYPLMSRLKREGLLSSKLEESPTGPARRTYTLTLDGKKRLKSINESWQEIAAAIHGFINNKDGGEGV